MSKQDFRRAYSLVRGFAKANSRSPVGYDYKGRMGLATGFSSEASVFVNREISGGRFYLDATDEQMAATRAAIDAFAAREIASTPVVNFLNADGSYDYT